MHLHPSLIEQLKTHFRTHLNAHGYSQKTITGYVKVLAYYLGWLLSEQLPYRPLSYPQLLSFVQSKREKGDKIKTINQNLMVLRTFYQSLLLASPNDPQILSIIQITKDLKLIGGTRFILHDLLSEQLLEQMYLSCPTQTLAQIRNKSVLGMMIYQALHFGDISRLEVADLDLEKGKVLIRATRRSNERTLNLAAPQLLGLQKYLLSVRPGLLNYSKSTSKAAASTNKLFIGENGANAPQNFRGSITYLYQQLRATYPELQHINQIRSSVIRHWLQKDNIRVVQYQVGHRYLSSTQLYLEGDIESLQQQINRLHPLQ